MVKKATSAPKAVPIFGAVALVALVVVVGVLHMQSVSRKAAQQAAATPRVLSLVDETRALNAKAYDIWSFVVAGGTHCHLAGHAQGVMPKDEFSVVVMTEDNAVEWEANGSGATIFQSAKVTDTPIDVDLPGPGKYDLIVSNRAAWLLRHNVHVKAELSCTTDWPPAGNAS